MKKALAVIVILLFVYRYSYAQEQGLYEIKIEQDFEAYNNCKAQGYPYLSDMTITANDNKKDSVGTIITHSDKKHTSFFVCTLDSLNETISIKNKITGLGNKGEDYFQETKIRLSDLKTGRNTGVWTVSDSHHCSIFHTEGYTMNTSITIDDPINLKGGENAVIDIDKGGEWSVEVEKFYDDGKCDVYLEYNVNSADSLVWNRIANNEIVVKPGTINLRYEDIVGKKSDTNDKYKESIGKFITLRAVKVFSSSGVKTYGATIQSRFYQSGPDFEIMTIRRPACKESLNIYVKVDKDALVNPRVCQWKIIHNFSNDNNGPAFILTTEEIDDDGFLKLSEAKQVGNNSVTLAYYLSESTNRIEQGDWTLQLEYIKEIDATDFECVEKIFHIPAKLDSLKVSQLEKSLFERNGVKYHLTNTQDPYVVLKIEDNDQTEKGRLPYSVYDRTDNLLAEITDTIKIDTDTLKADFKNKYNYNNLATEWAKEWFDKNTNLAKVERIDTEIVSAGLGNSRVEPVLVMRVGDYDYTYLSYDCETLYRMKGIWESSYSSKGIDNGADQVIFIGTDNDNDPMSYVLYKEKSAKNGEYDIVDAEDIGELIQGNNRFLVLKNSNGNYTIIDIYYKEQIEVSDLSFDFEDTCKVHVNSNGDVVVVNENEVKLYKYNDKYNDKYNERIWDSGTIIKLQFSPKSAKNVVFENNYDDVEYTSIDIDENGVCKSYKEYSTILKEKFIENFVNDKAVNLSKNDFSERYEHLWRKYYLQHYGYHVHGIKINQNDTLILKDNDGCEYTIPYRVNVLDDIVIAEINRTNPSRVDTIDGRITLTVSPGGEEIYYYKCEAITKVDTIGLTDLPWGETEVEFTDKEGNVIYTHKVSLLPNVEFEVTSQTCVQANGAIRPLGDDEEKCSQWQHKNPSMPDSDENWKDGLDSLSAGEYSVRGMFGKLWIEFGPYTISDEIFDIEVKEIRNATTMDGKGSVTFNVMNYDKDFPISGDGTNDDLVNNGEITYSLKPQKYKWIASNSGCEIPIDFEIQAPSVEIVDARVIYDAATKEVKVHMEGLKNDLVGSYQFLVDNKPFAKDITLKDKEANSVINIYLKYTTTQSEVEHTIDIAEIELVPYTPEVTVDTAYNNIRCPSKLGKVKLNNANGGELKVDYGQYESIEDDGINEIELSTGNHTLQFRKCNKVGTPYGNIDFIVEHNISDVEIVKPKQPYIRIASTDVTCKGYNDGQLYIAEYENVRGSAQYCSDELEWYSSIDTIKDQSPGLHHVYVRDSVCPADTSSSYVVIEEPATPLVATIINITNPTCHNNDGIVTIEAEGGWDYYIASTSKLTQSAIENEFNTENFNNNLYIDNLAFGNHTIYVHDIEGCYVEIDTILPEYTSPQIINAAGKQTSCYGNADGKIIIDSVKTDCTVENSPLSLIIRDSSDTISISIPYQTVIEQLSEGSYELKIIDKNKCTSEPYFVTITEPEPVKVEVYVYNDAKITYKGGDDGKMNIIVSGGNEELKTIYYGDTSICVPTNVLYSVEGLRAGMIDISATDENGCSSNMVQVTFDEPKQALSIETETEPALCHAMTGAVKVKAEGGWGNYGIKLVGEREERNITGQKEVTFEGLSAGDYELTVTDERGAKIRQTVRVNAPEPIDHTLIITPDQCEGNGVGEITLSGGTPEYRSLFNMETDTIRGGKITLDYLKGGRDYTLTTWDANRCESKMTFSVPDEQLKAEIKHEYNNDGVLLTADVTGGVKPITYNWHNKSKEEEVGTTSQITVNQSGLYLLEVTDISGCMRSVMKSVLMSGSLSMRVKSVKRATNIANDNGMAEIICHATQSPNVRLYHLESDTWKTDISMSNDTVIILRGLQSGHYYVEGNLGNGNIQTTEFTIEPYKEMELLSLNIKHVSEPNKNDARVVAYIEGGIAPYKVEGTYFATKYIELNGIKSGLYTMTIADSTGNKFTKEIEILEPEKLKIDISEKNDATCNSSSDGFVKLKATGGWGEYQFAVEEGDYKNSVYIGQLKAGERQFKVIDKYGIEDSVRVTIGEPDPLRATLVAIDSVSCKGLRDGAVYFDVIGGTAPYRTIYEKETLEGVVVTNLSSDNYNMTFTDSHSCISKDTIHVNIPEPELLEVAKAEVNNTTCELDNGKIALEIQGGSLPYNFEWSENGKEYLNAKNVGVKRSEASELKRNGLYTVTVKDKNGCTTHYERRIATSTNPRVKNVETIDVLCYGSSDGVAIVDSSNVVYGEPRASYHLTWPQGQEGVMSVNTLSAGTYKVRITDENNCTTTTEFVVGTPEPVKNQLVKLRDALCYGYNDGRIETNTIGGVGNYKYVWSTGESTSFADSLKAGQYMVVVADNHECRDTAVYTVAEPEKLTVELGDDALICPGSSYTFDAGEYAKYEWRRESNDSIIETNRQLTTNQGGEYYILVKNEKGCIAQDTIFLGIGKDALVANFLVSSNITISDTIVAIELSNMPVDSIRWEYDETAFIDITADEDESYIKKIRSEKIGTQYITMWAYSGGCMSSDTKQIEVYDIIEEYDSFNLGYDPLIKSVKIAPNPNNGEFFLLVTLREKYDVEVQINDVTTGHVVEKRKLTESDRYEEYINIRTWGSGIYVLSITAGEERRVVKILSVN